MTADKRVSNYLTRAENVFKEVNIINKEYLTTNGLVEIAKMIQLEEQNQTSNAIEECKMNRM